MLAEAAAASALIGGLIQGIGAKSASKQQVAAMREAMAQRERMFGKAQEAWSPFMQGGQEAWGLLSQLLGVGADSGNALTGGGGRFGELTRRFSPADLINEPGYQWNLDQATRAMTNAATRSGLGGNAVAGIGKMASGLAESTYGNAFNRYQQSNKAIYDMLWGPSQMGTQGAASLTGAATQTGAGLASDAAGIGNANAAGTNALWGGIGQGVASAGNLLYQNEIMSNLAKSMGQRGGGGMAYGLNTGDFNPNEPGGFVGWNGGAGAGGNVLTGGVTGAPPANAAVMSPLWLMSGVRGGW